MKKEVALLTLSGLLCGCMLGPDFESPAVSQGLPTAFRGGSDGRGAVQQTVETSAAEKVFSEDPILSSLLQKTLEQNYSIRMAASRIEQSRAALGMTRASLFPTLGGSGNASRTRNIDPDGYASSYRAGLDASWELDLFGKNRRETEAAAAELEAMEYTLEDARLSVASELVLDYIELRYAQQALEIAQTNLACEVASAKIARAKGASGFYAGLDVDSAEAAIATAEAAIPAREAAVANAIRAIEYLCGCSPYELDELLKEPGEIPEITGIGGASPASLLAARPDVRIAEARLHAATARIGVARAARYPSLDLSAGATVTAASLSSWSSAIKSISYGGGLSVPIFQAGRLASAEEQARAAADEALLSYHDTVLSAVHEAQQGLTSLSAAKERTKKLEQALASNEKALAAANALYEAGEVDYNTVIVRQNALSSSRLALVENQREVASQSIAFRKALGRATW